MTAAADSHPGQGVERVRAVTWYESNQQAVRKPHGFQIQSRGPTTSLQSLVRPEQYTINVVIYKTLLRHGNDLIKL